MVYTYLPIVIVLRILPINLFYAVFPLDVPKWIEALMDQFDCLHERLHGEWIVRRKYFGGSSVASIDKIASYIPEGVWKYNTGDAT